MRTKKNILLNCITRAESETKKMVSIISPLKKRGRPRAKVMTKLEIRRYIMKYHGQRTAQELGLELNLKTMQVAGIVASVNRAKNRKAIAKDTTNKQKVGRIESKADTTKKEKVSIGAIPETFTNYHGKNRCVARQKGVDFIAASGINSGKILSLPAVQLLFEKLLCEKFSKEFEYDFAEYSEVVFKKMLKTIIKTPEVKVKTVHSGNISNLIDKAVENEYSHAVLDYCQTFDKIKADVKKVLTRNIVSVNGVIVVAFCTRGTSKELSRMGKIIPQDKGVNVEYSSAEFANIFFNFFDNYQVLEMFSYKDIGKAPLMIVYLKRIS